MRKRALIGHGILATRTIVVAESYCVDVLEWGRDANAPSAPASADNITITLPVCAGARHTTPSTFEPIARSGAGGLEDGFDFIHHLESSAIIGTAVIDACAASSQGAEMPGASAQLRLASNVPATLHRARAPGAPGCEESIRHFVELRGATGRLVSVWHWAPVTDVPAVEHVALDAGAAAVRG